MIKYTSVAFYLFIQNFLILTGFFLSHSLTRLLAIESTANHTHTQNKFYAIKDSLFDILATISLNYRNNSRGKREKKIDKKKKILKK
jgi:hypothetical protein